MTTARIPRGIRNNNPGNIEHGQNWQGMAPVQGDERFITFSTPEYGIRALARVLLTYKNRHRINTVHALINRYAPPAENDVAAYARNVAAACQVEPAEIIDLEAYLPELVKSIIRHENGEQPYTDEQILRGIALALGEDATGEAA